MFQNEKTPNFFWCFNDLLRKCVDIFHIVGLLYLPIFHRVATNQRAGAVLRQESPPHERSLLSPPQFSPKASSPKSPLRRMSRDTRQKGRAGRCRVECVCLRPVSFSLGLRWFASSFFWWGSPKKVIQWILFSFFFVFWWFLWWDPNFLQDKSLETNPQNHLFRCQVWSTCPKLGLAGQQCKSESNESTWKEADSTHSSRSRPWTGWVVSDDCFWKIHRPWIHGRLFMKFILSYLVMTWRKFQITWPQRSFPSFNKRGIRSQRNRSNCFLTRHFFSLSNQTLNQTNNMKSL